MKSHKRDQIIYQIIDFFLKFQTENPGANGFTVEFYQTSKKINTNFSQAVPKN